ADETFGDWKRWAAGRVPDLDSLCGPHNAAADERIDAPQAWKTRLPEDLYSTNYIASRTEAFLENHATAHPEQPFFLQCSFPDPHHPFTPPGKYWDMYDPGQIEAPATCHSPGPDTP